MEPAESQLTPAHRAGWSAALGQAEVGRDRDPDEDERSEDPQQERGLADGKPRKLLASEEEPNAMRAAAVDVQLDDLTAHRCCGIAGRLSLAVAIENRALGHLPSGHRLSVALGAQYTVVEERSST